MPYPAAPAPAPQHANQPPPSPAKSLPPPTSPVRSPPPPPPPPPPPSPSTVPETAKSPSPSFKSSPSPSPSPTSSPTSSPSPSPEAHPPPAAASPAATTAPVSAAGLFNLKGAVSGKACQSVWQVIGQDPDLSTWVALLNVRQLSNIMLSQVALFTHAVTRPGRCFNIFQSCLMLQDTLRFIMPMLRTGLDVNLHAKSMMSGSMSCVARACMRS